MAAFCGRAGIFLLEGLRILLKCFECLYLIWVGMSGSKRKSVFVIAREMSIFVEFGVVLEITPNIFSVGNTELVRHRE